MMHGPEIQEFQSEGLDLLDASEKALLRIHDLKGFQTEYNSIFRVFHSLKGAAGLIEFPELQDCMHQLEEILVSCKERAEIHQVHINLFLRGVDASREMIVSLKPVSFDLTLAAAPLAPIVEKTLTATEMVEADEGHAEFLMELEEVTQRLSESLAKIEKDGFAAVSMDAVYRDVHTVKGSAYLFGFQSIGELSHAMENVLEPIRRGEAKMDAGLVTALYASLDVIGRLAGRSKDSTDPELTGALQALTEISTQRIGGSMSVPTEKNVKPVLAVVPPAPEAPLPVNRVEVAKTSAEVHEENESREAAATIRVGVGLLDKMMTLMGEMVLVRNQVLQYASRSDDFEFLNLSQRLDVVTGELQSEMMKTRMQPIGNVLSKFQRVVRDLAQSLQKKVEINLYGTETELDRTLLEAIRDPLTHIIRNSCDHGLETPEERRVAGKPETGTISVRAFHEGGQVIVEISDDGRGLSREKILAKALERGLIPAEKVAGMSEREVFGLIFTPGFSTATRVTNVSGRGVGMDVVRSNIEKIGGMVDLNSQAGRGTVIRMKIPLTLAIVPAMIIRCGQDRYAIPQVKLVELVRAEGSNAAHKVEYLQGKPVFRLRGKLLPLVDLKGLLKFPVEEAGETLKDEYQVVNIVVLNAESQLFGLIVDEILDTADIVVKPLSRFLKSLAIYSGATVLGDGTVVFILDVLGLAGKELLLSESSKTDSAFLDMRTVAESNSRAREEREYLLFRLNAPTKYAVALRQVHRLEEFKIAAVEYSGGQRVMRYRGSLLPLISLNETLDFPKGAGNLEVLSVIVLQAGDQTYGIEVNEILDVYSSELNADHSLSDRPGILGNLITSQEVIVVVDSDWILEQAGARLSRGRGPVKKQGKSILLVEDTAFIRKQVTGMLEKAGYRVLAAADGREAIDCMQAAPDHHFDLVISDIEMPRMNGLEFAQAVRADARWKAIPMVALTSRYDEESIRQGNAAGFDRYLKKTNPGELLETLRNLSGTEPDLNRKVS